LQGSPGLLLTPRGGSHYLECDIHSARTVVRAPYLALSAGTKLVHKRVPGIELLTFDDCNSLSHNSVRLSPAGFVQCAGASATGCVCCVGVTGESSSGAGAPSTPFSSRYSSCSSLRHSRYCSSAVPVSFRVRPSTSTTCGATSSLKDSESSFSASACVF